MTGRQGRRLPTVAVAGWTLAFLLTLTVPASGLVVSILCVAAAAAALLHREVPHAPPSR